MKMEFDLEELVNEAGQSVLGTVVVDVATFDASYSHDRGTESGVDIEITVDGFTPVGECPFSDGELVPLLESWRVANEERVIEAWRKELWRSL